MPAICTNGDPLHAVLTALHDGGARTAGQLADYMHIPYPSLTPRLRQLELDGRAERVKDPHTRVQLWQATSLADVPGSLEPAAAEPDPAADPATGTPLDEPDTTPDGSDAASATPSAAINPARGDTEEPETQSDAADSAPPTSPGPDRGTAPHRSDSTEKPGTADAGGGEAGRVTTRRAHGTIPAAILALTRAHPESTYRVSQLSRELGGISAGAIANAAHKLAGSGELICVTEHPATFQAA